MPKIILSFKGNVLAEYPIGKERITIGRRPYNDIAIDNLAVSGEHAAVVSIYNYHFLEDLNSTNGTFINDKEITKQVLNNNDLIQIGKHELRYINEEAASETGFQKTVVIRSPAPGKKATPPADNAEAGYTHTSSPAYLKILNGPNSGKHLGLTNISTTIGRQGAQLAVITRRSDDYYINRGRGKIIPLVNDESVDEKQLLKNHDVIELDNIKMEFVLNY